MDVEAIQKENEIKATKKYCGMYVKNGELNKKEIRKKSCGKDHSTWVTTIGSIKTATKLKSSIILADIRSKKATTLLINSLEKQLRSTKKIPFMAEHLSVQLAKLGDFKATDTLLKMVSNKFALRKIKKQKGMARKVIQLTRRGQEVSIRMKGAEALAILGDKAALPYLLKVINGTDPTAEDMAGREKIFFEPRVWAADAYSRISTGDDKAEFLKAADALLKKCTSYITRVEKNAKDFLDRRYKTTKPSKAKLDKEVAGLSNQDINYVSAKRSAGLIERFINRVKLAGECGSDTACYKRSAITASNMVKKLDNEIKAYMKTLDKKVIIKNDKTYIVKSKELKKLKDKESTASEKYIFIAGFQKKMSINKDDLEKYFYHETPYVRDALSLALLKTNDKKFIPIIEKAMTSEGNKVEYANSSKEFKAIASYLETL